MTTHSHCIGASTGEENLGTSRPAHDSTSFLSPAIVLNGSTASPERKPVNHVHLENPPSSPARVRVSRTRRRVIIGVGLVLIALVTTLVTAGLTRRAASATHPTFGSDDVYRVDLREAPLDQNSPAMIKNLMGQITPNWGGVAALNTTQYNVAFHIAARDTPKVRVAFDDCQNKG